MRHAMPHPADNLRGTGTSRPAIPFCLQNDSISMAASVVWKVNT